MYEDEVVDPTDEIVETRPARVYRRERVVREVPATTYEPPPVYTQPADPAANAAAAGNLIMTVVFSVVVLTILVVGILVLVHYNII
ncbi:MAG TPA: hypothetical protein VFB34_07740 [Chloroflexota bacterium]|nr:hypothetical protein [Chloroflexota bacterium]